MKLRISRARVLRHIEQAIAEANAVEEKADRERIEARETARAMERARDAIKSVQGSNPVVVNSRRIAGPAAIAAVRWALDSVGRTTQAALTKKVERNSGTVSHALKVLEEEGHARKTGRRHKGSEEWAITERGRHEASAHDIPNHDRALSA